MTHHDHDRERERELDEEGRPPRVKFTDKRRVHADDAADAPQPPVVEPDRPVRGVAEPADAELEEAKRQAAEYLDHLQRLQAEFANYKKRVLKEQTRAIEMAVEPMIARLLEVLDEFDLALMAAEQKPDFDKFLHGVELVYAKLKDIFGAEGLQRIDAEGKPFDPEHHEALMQTGSGEGEPVVSDVLRNGYTLKGRVIRPAGVKVTRK
jgi:molecular chaperone GrpE